MAEIILASDSDKQKYLSTYLSEYTRESGLAPYMGKSETSIIHVRVDLMSGGSSVNIPLIGAIRQNGVTGSQVMSGNESDLDNYNDRVRIKWERNAVKTSEDTLFRTDIDLLGAAKSQLRANAGEKLHIAVVNELDAFVVPGPLDADNIPTADTTVHYARSTADQRNTHLANNADRTLFGKANSNMVVGNWDASLQNINATDGKLSAAMIRSAKTLAKKAGTKAGTRIKPYKSDMTAGREWYVMFVGSEGFRDLSQDATILAANTNARERNVETNPIFQDGDLMYSGVIIREDPDMQPVATGAGGVPIALAKLCGQTAVSVVWGAELKLHTEDSDYGFRHGVEIRELRGQKKTSYAGVQYSVVTIAHAAQPDA